jgi:hypothetical protein
MADKELHPLETEDAVKNSSNRPGCTGGIEVGLLRGFCFARLLFRFAFLAILDLLAFLPFAVRLRRLATFAFNAAVDFRLCFFHLVLDHGQRGSYHVCHEG